MTDLKAGDRIACRVKSGSIVSAYTDYDDTITLEIVSCGNEGYYVYVPHFLYLNGTSALDASRARRLGIAPRFIGEKVIHVSPIQIAKIVSQMDGLKCDRCQDFHLMAEPNQPDGGFLCWSCRKNPYR